MLQYLIQFCKARRYPRDIEGLAAHIGVSNLHQMTLQCIATLLGENIDNLLPIKVKISVFHSAMAKFHAPSDLSGTHGMRRERIRSTPSWRGRGPRRDCAFVGEDGTASGVRGMAIVRVILFFSFEYEGVYYPCALVEWFKKVRYDTVTGMWIVRPDLMCGRLGRNRSVIHLDTFYRGAHLIPVFGKEKLPVSFHYTHSLEAFRAFYVNKYIDHHANEIVF